MNLAEEQMNDVRSEAGSFQCRSQHRGGSMPLFVSYMSIARTIKYLLASQHAKNEQPRCLAQVSGCFRESQGARMMVRHPSYGQSCPEPGRVP
jgi:hypothetical protein